jgi:hypothetical protein
LKREIIVSLQRNNIKKNYFVGNHRQHVRYTVLDSVRCVGAQGGWCYTCVKHPIWGIEQFKIFNFKIYCLYFHLNPNLKSIRNNLIYWELRALLTEWRSWPEQPIKQWAFYECKWSIRSRDSVLSALYPSILAWLASFAALDDFTLIRHQCRNDLLPICHPFIAFLSVLSRRFLPTFLPMSRHPLHGRIPFWQRASESGLSGNGKVNRGRGRGGRGRWAFGSSPANSPGVGNIARVVVEWMRIRNTLMRSTVQSIMHKFCIIWLMTHSRLDGFSSFRVCW